MKTNAAVLYQTGKPLVIEELEVPQPQNGQVLVKVAFSGICHSQLNEIRGRKGVDKFLPHTLGHEGSGVVEDMGPGVTKVKKGDRVVLSWIKGRGIDVPATAYYKDKSKINSGAISTFLEHALISENRLVPITKEMPLDMAALLGCAIPTGAGIVINTLQAKPGSSIIIFGAGGVGLSAILAAALAKCTPIIAVDIYDHKLEAAKEMGATHTINASKEDPVRAILSLTGGKGTDYSIEASGTKQAMEAAFHSIASSGTAVIAGNLEPGEKIAIDPFDLIKGKRIIGSWGGETKPDTDIPLYVEHYLSGRLKLDKLITHRFKLTESNEAFAALEAGEVSRALVSM